VTSTSGARRPSEPGWPEEPPPPLPVEAEPAPNGWIPLQPEGASPDGNETGSDDGAVTEDARAASAGTTATTASTATLEASRTRIRSVLDDAVGGIEPPGAGDDGQDTPIMREAAQAVRVLNPNRDSAFPRPSRRRVITVANQKGGVGKTTSTVNLAVAFALHGLRVLVIDLDPQGNASTGLGVEHGSGTPSVYEVLVEGASLAETAVQVDQAPTLWCVPATIDLAGAEIELVSVVARENRLRSAIAAYKHEVDYILVDCPPSLGLLTVNALVAGDEVLIPIQCEYYALEGLGQLLQNIELIQAHLNDGLRVSTILLTMYDGRTRLADQVAQEVRRHFGDLVLDVVIPRSVRVSEAPGYGQSVLTYDPGSRGALTYFQAARQMAERGSRPEPAAAGQGAQ
jgi:chromosome partitioning protein